MSGHMTKVYEADTRRRWSEQEKQGIIEESKTAPVSQVAKKYGVATSLLFRWRKQQGIRVRSRSAHLPEENKFIPIALPAPIGVSAPSGQGGIEVVLGNGRRVIVGQDVDVSILKRVVAALEAA